MQAPWPASPRLRRTIPKEATLKEPIVYVIVLNWNGKQHLPVCLSSLERQTYNSCRVLVVDNGSTDGSVSCVRGEHPEVEILPLARNLGFAEANNRGVRYAMEREADFVILLNNDTECDRDFVLRLVEAAQSDSSIGACAPKMLFFDARSVINSIGTEATMIGCGGDRGMGEFDHGQYDEAAEVFGISGGACLLRTNALRKVGLFEPNYFIFLEDIDLSWRLRLAGYKILAVPGAVVYHKFNATMGSFSSFRIFLNEKNRIRNVLKNFSARTLLTVLPRMLRYDLKIVADILAEGGPCSLARAATYPRAYLWNLLRLPGLVAQRHRVRSFRVISDEEMMRFITPIYGQSQRITPDYPVQDRALYERASTKPTRIVMGETDRDSLGPGWANLHGTGRPDEKARRLSTDAYFFLPQAKGAEQTIEMELIGPPVAALCGNVFANGMDVGNYSLGKGARRSFRYFLPRGTPGGGAWECRIVTDKGWRPDDYYRNGDCRLLGPSATVIALAAGGENPDPLRRGCPSPGMGCTFS